MKADNQDLLSVERLLNDVQFTPTPVFRDSLYERLKKQLSLLNLEQIPKLRERLNGYHNGRNRKAWRWIIAGMAALCLMFAATTVMIPTVRAQVLSMLQYFEVRLTPERESIVASSFIPLVPEEIPSQLLQYVSLNRQDSGSTYVELRYFSQDTFVVIYETAAQTDETLPQGESIQIGDYAAILNSKSGGLVFLASQAPQPWREGGNGGGGGNFDDSAGDPPQQLIYDEAVQLTWIQSGLHVELLTNLPQDEALRMAASLQPVMQP